MSARDAGGRTRRSAIGGSLLKQVDRWCAQGEGPTVEFKANDSVTEDDVVAFANTDGGVIVFGVIEEPEKAGVRRGKVIGLAGSVAGVRDKVNNICSRCRPPLAPRFAHAKHKNGRVLVVWIAPGKSLTCTSSGTYKRRIDAGAQPLLPADLGRIILEQESETFLARFRTAAEGLSQTVSDLGERLEALGSQMEDLDDKLEKLEREISQVAETASSVETTAQTISETTDELRQLVDQVGDKVDEVGGMSEDAKSEVGDVSAQLERVGSLLDRVGRVNEYEIGRGLGELAERQEAGFAHVSYRHDELDEKLQNQQAWIEDRLEGFDEVKSTLADIERSLSEIDDKVDDTKSSVEDVENSVSTLQEGVDKSNESLFEIDRAVYRLLPASKPARQPRSAPAKTKTPVAVTKRKDRKK